MANIMDEDWAKDFMPEYEYREGLTREQNIQLMILIKANENYKAKYGNWKTNSEKLVGDRYERPRNKGSHQ